MLCFKHYNAQEVRGALSSRELFQLLCFASLLQVVMGKTMEEWLRFSVCFWHTFRGTGEPPPRSTPSLLLVCSSNISFSPSLSSFLLFFLFRC